MFCLQFALTSIIFTGKFISFIRMRFDKRICECIDAIMQVYSSPNRGNEVSECKYCEQNLFHMILKKAPEIICDYCLKI